MILILSLLISVSFASNSNNSEIGYDQAFYNPIFTERFNKNVNSVSEPVPEEEPDWSRDLLSQYAEVRIKVFPHNSKYNAPQGKDTTINQVTVSSSGSCNIYKADNSTSIGGITRTLLLKSGNAFVLTPNSVSKPIWIECTQPISVKRVDYASNPISYSGVMFAKTVNANTANAYVTLVNVLPFETYLKGVVPSEMPASWNFEALKVQAIAARTYAFYELATKVYLQDNNITNEASGAQFDDTVTYQAYLGLKNTTTATNLAIDETAGQVMVHQGKIVKAYFHADSGGYTENAENVWGKYYPYIIAKPEVYPAGSIPGSEWSYTAPMKEVHDKLVLNKFIKSTDVISAITINKNELYPSTRPQFVHLTFADRTTKKLLAVDFAFAMRIKSAWIKITTNSKARISTVTMNGKGFGHGAGMNQWGARVMVDKLNKNFIDILKFYYTGVELTPQEKQR